MAQVKRIRRNVSGIILLDKPLGFTSNAALQKVRWLLNAEKAGHTGSLDPLASGVLPLCFGEATKFSQYLLDSDKGYETLMQLGKTTTTADAEGEVLQTRPVTVGRADIEAAIARYFATLSPGDTLVKSQLETVISEVAGVVDRTLTAPAANIQAGVSETDVYWLRPGEITVEYST